MVTILFTIFITYLITSLFGYIVHRALHQTWSGYFNKAHMTHHLIKYPPEDFLSDTYRNAGKDSTPKFFALAALPIILAPLLLGWFGILSWAVVITIMVVEGLMGFLHDYLHDSFHIKNHLLTKIPVINKLFDLWVKLHYQHHVDMNKNFGIFTFHWDKVFKTFLKNK